jgi:CBS domain-containing protein
LAFACALSSLLAGVDQSAQAWTSAPFAIAQTGPDEKHGSGVAHAPGDFRVKPTVPEPSQTPPGQATPGGDVLFGAKYVGFLTDHDVIGVGNEIGKFAKVRLRVIENDIHINALKVVYANDESDTLAVDADIPKNSRSDWIDLRGDRFIKQIEITYRARTTFNGEARIEVFGQYAPGWLSPNGEGSRYNQGWVLLGAQTAGFIGFDKDIIPVGSNEGGFRRIRIAARDRAITLNAVKVVYVDGSAQTIPVHARVDAGATFGPMELKGEQQQAIDHIEAIYRSRIFDSSATGKGAAIVEIWGQQY